MGHDVNRVLRIHGDRPLTIPVDGTSESGDWTVSQQSVGFECASGTWKEREWDAIPVFSLLDLADIPEETTHVQFESRDGDRACVPLADLEDGIIAVGTDDARTGDTVDAGTGGGDDTGTGDTVDAGTGGGDDTGTGDTADAGTGETTGTNDGFPRFVSPHVIGPRTIKNLVEIRPLTLTPEEDREDYERLPFEE